LRTHPKDHNSYVSSVNNKHSGAVKKLARQVKVWKYMRNVPVSSCYLEMRATKHMQGESSYAAQLTVSGVDEGCGRGAGWVRTPSGPYVALLLDPTARKGRRARQQGTQGDLRVHP